MCCREYFFRFPTERKCKEGCVSPARRSFLRWGTAEARFSRHRLTWSNANILLPFPAFPKPSALFTKLCLAAFYKFLGDSGGCLGRDSFS